MRLFDPLDFYAHATPDALFARSEESGGIQISYGEAAAASRRIANGLCARNIEKGERVGLLAKNRLDFLLLLPIFFKRTSKGV